MKLFKDWSPKVFCVSCIFYKPKYSTFCDHDKDKCKRTLKIVDYPTHQEKTYKRCKDLNSDNKCLNYKRKKWWQ